ncbi:unnamed protein product [Effrenium voratum]|nr:unnamed protein product [Effrenium voratum]
MVEKRSTGWAGRRGEDSSKLFDSPTISRRKPQPPERARSFVKPGLAIVYIYASVVILVWQLWHGKQKEAEVEDKEHDHIPLPEVVDTEAAATEGAATVGAPAAAAGVGAAFGKSTIESKPSQTIVGVSTAQATFARHILRSKAQLADVMPKSGEPQDLSFEGTGQKFEASGEFLRASWGWTSEATSGLVGDQRKQEARGLTPKALQVRESNLGWQNLFEFSFVTGEKVTSSNCSLVRSALLSERQAEKWKLIAGEAIELQCPKSLSVQWTAGLIRLAGGAEALRVRVLYTHAPEANIAVASLTMWDFDGAALAVCGSTQSHDCFGTSGEVDGSPLIDLGRGLWVAMEHPRAVHGLRGNGTRVVAEIYSPPPGVPYFASLGVTGGPTGVGVHSTTSSDESLFLLRRHFHSYLNQVRVSSPKPFLHYTTWYDLRRHPCVDSTPLGVPHCSAAKTLNEQLLDERIAEIQGQLSDRGVALSGALLDDGWDDAGTPWQVDSTNFPSGISAVVKAANDKGVSVGAWLSPWGGFGEGGKRRVKVGAAMGLEYHGDSPASPNTLRLAGLHYFDWFHNATLSLMDAGITFLKFDGIGSIKATGSGDFAEDVDKLLLLITELRSVKASLRLSAVTGVWPSPWWLLCFDSLWRGGPDLGRKGAGSPRQQWITFRDSMVFDLQRRAKLFPLSSLALGGLVWSRAEEPGAYLNSFDIEDFSQEVQSLFLSGAMHQELQIQPSLLAPAFWDILALYANMSIKYADILRHSHWMGGDPSQGEVYGYGAFSCPPCSGLMTWRNPHSAPQNTSFALRTALALPQAWPGGSVGGRWHVRNIAMSEVVLDTPQLDLTRDVDTSPLVGGSYALTQRVPLLESRTQDSEILGTLEVQAKVLVLNVDDSADFCLVLPYERFGAGWVAQPLPVSLRRLEGSRDVPGRYRVRTPAALHSAASPKCKEIAQVEADEEVLLFLLCSERDAAPMGKVKTARNKIGWMHLGIGMATLDTVNLMGPEVAEQPRHSFAKDAKRILWEVGRKYRTLGEQPLVENLEQPAAKRGSFDLVPGGCLVHVWEMRTLEQCTWMHVSVEDGPSSGLSGWIQCWNGDDLVDTREQWEFERLLIADSHGISHGRSPSKGLLQAKVEVDSSIQPMEHLEKDDPAGCGDREFGCGYCVCRLVPDGRSHPTVHLHNSYALPEPQLKDGLEPLSPSDVEVWLNKVYARYNPNLLPKVPEFMEKYADRESELVESVCRKYRVAPPPGWYKAA